MCSWAYSAAHVVFSSAISQCTRKNTSTFFPPPLSLLDPVVESPARDSRTPYRLIRGFVQWWAGCQALLFFRSVVSGDSGPQRGSRRLGNFLPGLQSNVTLHRLARVSRFTPGGAGVRLVLSRSCTSLVGSFFSWGVFFSGVFFF